MRRQQISILSSTLPDELRSFKELKSVCEDILEIQQKFYNEIEKLEYHAFTLEQQRKLGDASDLLFASIPLKKKLNPNKKTIGKHVKDLCMILLNWVIFSIKNDKKLQAYSILANLQKITDKKYPIKFVGRKFIRIKVCLYTGYYFVKERKPNAGLEYFLRGISLVNTSKSIELALQLYSMAGFAAFKANDNKKSTDFHICCIDIIHSTSSEDPKMHYIEAASFFNLSVAASLMYQRADAEDYISRALDIVIKNNISELKARIVSFYEEFFGEIQIDPESENEDQAQKMEFNFLPGAPEKNSNKIVELRCETPKDRNKRTKNSKRSLSRA